MTCICGHHEHAHAQDVGLCAAPEGCDCNQFRKAPAVPDSFVDEAKARQDAEWLAGSEADTAERNLARAYLALCTRATSGVTEAMVERFIAAMDVASDADVGREEGIRYALSAAFAEARKDSERLDWMLDSVMLDGTRYLCTRLEIDAARTPQPETPE